MRRADGSKKPPGFKPAWSVVLAAFSATAVIALVFSLATPLSSKGDQIAGLFSNNSLRTLRTNYSARIDGAGALAISYSGAIGEETFFEETVRYPMGKEEALAEIRTKEALLESIFREIPSPYPGDLSRRIICPDELLPAKNESPNGLGTAVYLPAGKGLGYGVCSSERVAYESIYVSAYCEDRGILREIRAFSRTDSFQKARAPDLADALRKAC